MATQEVVGGAGKSSSVNASKQIVVVGADGFLGACLAGAFRAVRVMYGPCSPGDIHVSEAQQAIASADIVINASGFRVRPGCTIADYRRSHEGATAAIVPYIRRGAVLLHISSASVLGRSKTRKLGDDAPPHPETFPSPAYATAKIEADRFVEKAAAKCGFKAMFLRPAVVYSAQGAGMIETMIKLAKRGITLRLYPRDAKHHLCHTDLLIEVFRRVVEQADGLPHLSCFIAADPFTVTNRELETMINCYARQKTLTIPLPVPLLSAVLRHTFHSKTPRLDLKTYGEIFGVLNYDTEYDPSGTFKRLGIDPSRYSIEKTLKPVIEQAFVS